MRDAVLATLSDILADDFRVPRDAILESARLRSDLWLDSGSYLDLLYVVQKDFGFVVDAAAFDSVTTVGELADFVVSQER